MTLSPFAGTPEHLVRCVKRAHKPNAPLADLIEDARFLWENGYYPFPWQTAQEAIEALWAEPLIDQPLINDLWDQRARGKILD